MSALSAVPAPVDHAPAPALAVGLVGAFAGVLTLLVVLMLLGGALQVMG